MYDPMTVAHEIKRPWPQKVKSLDPKGWRYFPAILVIWHVDPETDGSDDSCDWFNRKGRRLRIHPRWHVLHWRIQVPLLLDLKRWLWSRCRACGERFRWGYAPVTNSWNSPGPRWFRGETDVYHADCSPPCKPYVPRSEFPCEGKSK